ncbi:MAG: hypothetical protein JWP91_3040 [Fibrobacteres bacterium]|nr:hypothetical protein [Fibrobacterota bacterium]
MKHLSLFRPALMYTLVCLSSGFTRPQSTQEPDSRQALPSILSGLEMEPTDSLVVDTLRCKDRYSGDRIRELNKAMRTGVFSAYECMRTLKVYKRSQGDGFPVAMTSLVDFPAGNGKKVANIMEKNGKGYFVSKVFNRYRWHLGGNTLILTESFSHDPDPLYARMDSLAEIGAEEMDHPNKGIEHVR